MIRPLRSFHRNLSLNYSVIFSNNLKRRISSIVNVPTSKSLLFATHSIKTSWLKSIVRETIPFTAQTISDRGQSVDNLEISVSYCNPVPPVFDEKSPTKDVVGKKRIDDSWLELYLPYSQHSYLRDAMATFDGSNMRYGKLFEVLDALAADVAYRHIGGKKGDMYIVTAAVDRMKILSHISLQNDFKLQGYLTYVGKSSLNVTIDMISVMEYSGKEVLVGSTEFVMVARSGNESAVVPRLWLHSIKMKAAFAAGQRNVERRKSKALVDLSTVPPHPDEMNVIHSLYLQSKRIQDINEYALRGIPFETSNIDTSTRASSINIGNQIPILSNDKIEQGNYLWMSKTIFKNTQFMHLQNRNVHGKIFGGFIMRIAYELAHVAARCFIGKDAATFVFVDEITFVKPIEVGAIIEFVAMVTYNCRDHFVVQVSADDVSPVNSLRRRTNLMTFLYKSDTDLPQVIPFSYEEMIAYLNGKRAFEDVMMLSHNNHKKQFESSTEKEENVLHDTLTSSIDPDNIAG